MSHQKEDYWGHVNPIGIQNCYVDDPEDAKVRFMEEPENISGPINLGNPDTFTIQGLADLVFALTGSKSKIKFRLLRLSGHQCQIARAW